MQDSDVPTLWLSIGTLDAFEGKHRVRLGDAPECRLGPLWIGYFPRLRDALRFIRKYKRDRPLALGRAVGKGRINVFELTDELLQQRAAQEVAA